MKYYLIPSTIEIKTTVVPSREINTHVIFMSFLLILSQFRPFLLIFVILLIMFIDFLSHFIDHFYNIFRSSHSGPC